jgi:hypothetical protein
MNLGIIVKNPFLKLFVYLLEALHLFMKALLFWVILALERMY